MTDVTAPTVPGRPVLTNPTATSVTLTWAAASDNVGVTAYRVLKSGTTFDTNGLTGGWVQRALPVSGDWRCCAYGGGMFVALGYNSAVAVSSPDAVTWTQRALPVAVAWKAVAYGNGVFVAVASFTSVVATSPDGITWTQRAQINGVTWSAITYAAGLFVAVADSGYVATSPDGITWTNRTTLSSGAGLAIVYAAGLFVVTGLSGSASTSPDGITWTSRSLPGYANWTALAYGSGLFVAGCDTANQTYYEATSPDGITWSFNNMKTQAWKAAAAGNGQIMIVSADGSGIAERGDSPFNPANWSVAKSMGAGVNAYAVVFANAVFVAPVNLAAAVVVTALGPDTTYAATALSSTTPTRFTITAGDAAGNFSTASLLAAYLPCPEQAGASDAVQLSRRLYVETAGAGDTRTAAMRRAALDATGPADQLVPAPPAAPTGSAGTAAQVTLTWAAPVGSLVAAATYRVWMNGAVIASPGAALTVTVSGLNASARYLFTVTALNATGGESNPSAALVYGDVTAPTVPGTPSISNVTTSALTLTWAPSTDAGTLAGYRVYVGGVRYTPKPTWSLGTTPGPGIYSWTSITYGAGMYVATAEYPGYTSAVAASSPDGITWTQRTLPASAIWPSVAYGGGMFVAIAGGNAFSTTAASSPDGITWTARTLPTNAVWSQVAYGGGMFVAVAGHGNNYGTAAVSSPDGITWTARTLPTYASWYAVAWGNGVFVAVATSSSNAAVSSPDGITWTARTLPATGYWQSVAYGAGLFVAINIYGQAATSPDGATWTARTMPTTGLAALAYGSGTFLAVSNSSSTIGAVSADGITWTAQSQTPATLQAVVYGGAGLFVAGDYTKGIANITLYGALSTAAEIRGLDPALRYSLTATAYDAAGNESAPSPAVLYGDVIAPTVPGTPSISNLSATALTLTWAPSTDAVGVRAYRVYRDGILYATANRQALGAWTARTLPVGNYWGVAVYGNGVFLAVSNNGSTIAATSPDGITWTQRTLPNQYITSVAFTGTQFVGAGYYPGLSADGAAWSATSTQVANALYGVAYGNGLYVATALNNGLYTSVDTLAWTQRTFTGYGSQQLQSIAYGNGVFVAVSNNTPAGAVSTDGITWTATTLPVNSSWKLAFGNGVFVAVPNGATAMTSTDGVTWTQRALPASLPWSGLTFAASGAGLFIATTNASSLCATSPDGITWTQQSMPAGYWIGVAASLGTVAAVAYGASSTLAATAPLTAVPSTTVTGLTSGVSYAFTTTAVDAAGNESNPSAAVQSPQSLSFTDAAGPADTALVGRWLKIPTDTAAASDATSKVQQQVTADPAGGTDVVARLIRRPLPTDSCGPFDMATRGRRFTETSGALDTTSMVWRYVRKPVDLGGTVDAVARTVLLRRTDTAGATDPTAKRILRPLPEETATGPAVADEVIRGRVFADPAGSGDSIALVWSYGRKPVDLGGPADAVARSEVLGRTDNAGAADLIVKRVQRLLAPVDDTGAADLAVLRVLLRTAELAVDAADVDDTTIVAVGRRRTFTDPGAVTDAGTRAAVLGRTEQAGGTDTVRRAGARPLLDDTGGADTAALRSVARSVDDTGAADQVVPSRFVTYRPTDRAGTYDVRAGAMTRAPVELAAASDVVLRTMVRITGLADTGGGSDAITAVRLLVRLYETAGSGDDAQVAGGNRRLFAEPAGASDRQASVVWRPLAEVGGAADQVVRRVLLAPADTTGAADTTGTRLLARCGELCGAGDQVAVTALRRPADTTTGTDTAAATYLRARTPADLAAGTDLMSRRVELGVTDPADPGDASGARVLARSVDDTGAADQVFLSGFATYRLTDRAGAFDVRAETVLRAVTDTSTGADAVVLSMARTHTVTDDAGPLDTSGARVTARPADTSIGTDQVITQAGYRPVDDGGATDQGVPVYLRARHADDTAGAVEQVVVTAGRRQSFADDTTSTDLTRGRLTVARTEQAGPGDSVELIVGFRLTPVNDAGAGDSVVLTAVRLLLLDERPVAADTAAIAAQAARAFTDDTGSAGDVVTIALRLTLVDQAGTHDVLDAGGQLARRFTDGAGGTDAAVVAVRIRRDATEHAGAGDSVVMGSALLRVAADNTGASDTWVRTAVWLMRPADDAGAADQPAVTGAGRVTLTEDGGAGDTALGSWVRLAPLVNDAGAGDKLAAAGSHRLRDDAGAADLALLVIAHFLSLQSTEVAGARDATAAALGIRHAEDGGARDATAAAVVLVRGESGAPTDTTAQAVTLRATELAGGTELATGALRLGVAEYAGARDVAAAAVVHPVTDSVAAGDAAGLVLTARLTDTGSATDALGFASTLTLHDTATATDTSTWARTRRLDSDTGAADTAVAARLRPLTELTAALDTTAAALTRGTVAEDTGALDTAHTALVLAPVEPGSTGDQVLFARHRSAAEQDAGATDTPALAAVRHAGDNTGAADTSTLGTVLQPAETAGALDQISAAQSRGLTRTDEAGALDRIAAALLLAVTDQVPAADTLTAAVRLNTSSSAGARDVTAAALLLALGDDAGARELVSLAEAQLRELTEDAGALDTAGLRAERTRTAADNTGALDQATRATLAARTEDTGSLDTAATHLLMRRELGDQAATSDTVTLIIGVHLSVLETAGATDATVVGTGRIRYALELAGAQDVRTRTVGKRLTETAGSTERLVRSGVFTKALSELAGAGERCATLLRRRGNEVIVSTDEVRLALRLRRSEDTGARDARTGSRIAKLLRDLAGAFDKARTPKLRQLADSAGARDSATEKLIYPVLHFTDATGGTDGTRRTRWHRYLDVATTPAPGSSGGVLGGPAPWPGDEGVLHHGSWVVGSAADAQARALVLRRSERAGATDTVTVLVLGTVASGITTEAAGAHDQLQVRLRRTFAERAASGDTQRRSARHERHDSSGARDLVRVSVAHLAQAAELAGAADLARLLATVRASEDTGALDAVWAQIHLRKPPGTLHATVVLDNDAVVGGTWPPPVR